MIATKDKTRRISFLRGPPTPLSISPLTLLAMFRHARLNITSTSSISKSSIVAGYMNLRRRDTIRKWHQICAAANFPCGNKSGVNQKVEKITNKRRKEKMERKSCSNFTFLGPIITQYVLFTPKKMSVLIQFNFRFRTLEISIRNKQWIILSWFLTDSHSFDCLFFSMQFDLVYLILFVLWSA